uniref:Retrovirus-related Pol polyprotein from transposon TNT 1-94 n=1 Tax=Cajanus cajan TaxID=3821 RepID=A0A151TC94_CAJCA|nr:Retrovirus-related Pol polyprotein from transposon TNT 1-94 [Cajanus cajan]
MDSGCSYHMCPKKDYFETLKFKEGGTVLLGDDHPCQVQGIGTVRLKMFDNREYILKDVRYVPDLKRNLISISMFDSLGYATKTQHGVLKILNGSLVIAKGNKDKNNGLFVLDGSTVMAHASIARNDIDKTKLWHLRLGHVSERGLIELFCEHCVLGKSHKVKFGTGIHVSSRPFEYVHADLWGPSRVKTPGGGSYFLTIVDDFTRRMWLYVLKDKTETYKKFKDWNTLIQNQLETKLKILRTDNGLEFLSEQFAEFCRN